MFDSESDKPVKKDDGVDAADKPAADKPADDKPAKGVKSERAAAVDAAAEAARAARDQGAAAEASFKSDEDRVDKEFKRVASREANMFHAVHIREMAAAGGNSRSLRMLMTMPALLAAAAVFPIVAARSPGDDGVEGFEVDPAALGRRSVGDRLWDAALAVAGAAAVVLLLRRRVDAITIWLAVVVPLWVVSLLRERRRECGCLVRSHATHDA
jgi:Flp pilus assembly protein TadB